jgi:acyl dehydratase
MDSQLHFEDVAEGMSLPPLAKETYYMQLVEYASASRDFYIIHHDRDYAKGVGLPDVIIQGSLKAAFLGQVVTNWMGQWGTLKRFAVQYRGIDVPGNPLTAKGVVTKAYTRDGERYVECDLWLENIQGEHTTKGTALVALPARSGS